MTKTAKELTEDWKARKLVQGWYFCKLKNGLIHHFEFNGNDFTDLTRHIPPVAKILAPCNYDEYKAMQDQIADASKKVEELEGRIADLLTDLSSSSFYQTVLNEDIATLRGLLKEFLPIVSAEIMTWQIRGGEEAHKRGQKLLSRINAALGDNKIQANPLDCNKIQESEEK